MTVVALPYGRKRINVEVPDDNFLMVAWPRGLPGSVYVDFEIKRAINSEGIEPVINENTLLVLDSRIPRRYYKAIINYIASFISEESSGHRLALAFTVPPLGGVQRFGDLAKLMGDSKVAIVDPWKSKYKEKLRIRNVPIFISDFFEAYNQIILVSMYTYDELFGYLGGIEYLWVGFLKESLIDEVAKVFISDPWAWGVRNGFSNEVSRSLLEFLPPVLSIHLILNYEGEIIKAYAGEPLQVATKAEKFLDRLYLNKLYRGPDALVLSAGGYPADSTLFSALLALVNSGEILEQLERIYFLAECGEGYGNRLLEKLMIQRLTRDYIRRLDFDRWDDVRAVFRYLLFLDIQDRISIYSSIKGPQTKEISEIVKDLDEAYRAGNKMIFVPYGDETVLTM